MAFQFLCPQGHLLQGEESQAGQQCKCPYCDSLFLVPQPAAADAGAAGPPTVAPPGFDSGGYQPPMYEEPAAEPQGAGEEGFPGIQTPANTVLSLRFVGGHPRTAPKRQSLPPVGAGITNAPSFDHCPGPG